MIISDQTKGTLFCVVGVLVLTPDAFYIRSVSNMPDFTVQFYRYLIFGLTVLCFFCIREGGQTLQKIKAIGVWGGLAGIAFGASNVCVTTAFQHTAAANALVIIASGPIFSALFSFLVLKEMVPLRTVAAGCVCFAAVALILQAEVQKGGNERLGVFCALSASILNGIYFTLLRLVSIKQSPMPDTLPCVFISGLVAATIAACTGPNLRAVDSMDWLFLVIMGVIELPISFSLLSYGPGLIPAPEVSLYFLFETVLGPLWVWLGGYEAPPIYSIYGGAMMITAMAAHSYLALRELKQKEDSLLFGVPAPTRSVDGGL